jgi:hypothetical protein
MAYFIVKTLITALIVAAISELSRRFSLFAAALASLPLVSILAFIWIYVDTKDTQKLIIMSHDVFWLVLPSLAFFLIFPALLKQGIAFGWAMLVACLCMIVIYGLAIWLLKVLGG